MLYLKVPLFRHSYYICCFCSSFHMPTKQYVNTCSISRNILYVHASNVLVSISLHVQLLLYIHTCHRFLLPPPPPSLLACPSSITIPVI
jgi:hypothetical protein